MTNSFLVYTYATHYVRIYKLFNLLIRCWQDHNIQHVNRRHQTIQWYSSYCWSWHYNWNQRSMWHRCDNTPLVFVCRFNDELDTVPRYIILTCWLHFKYNWLGIKKVFMQMNWICYFENEFISLAYEFVLFTIGFITFTIEFFSLAQKFICSICNWACLLVIKVINLIPRHATSCHYLLVYQA